MKSIFVFLFLSIFSLNTFALINKSQLSERHQQVIELAINKSCAINTALTQIDHEEIMIRVDQGITDYKYVTVLATSNGQELTVHSEYADLYNHETHEWGAYTVTKIESSHPCP